MYKKDCEMQSFFVLYPIMASISELYKKHNHNNSYTFYH